MGEYVKSKKDMNFASIDSLKSIQSVIDEADKALNDKSRRISDSPLSEVLTGALGAGLGAGIGFAALYLGGSAGLSAIGITTGLATAGAVVGGGMVAGIAVLAAPAVASYMQYGQASAVSPAYPPSWTVLTRHS